MLHQHTVALLKECLYIECTCLHDYKHGLNLKRDRIKAITRSDILLAKQVEHKTLFFINWLDVKVCSKMSICI